jgi:hypothetical protein
MKTPQAASQVFSPQVELATSGDFLSINQGNLLTALNQLQNCVFNVQLLKISR